MNLSIKRKDYSAYLERSYVKDIPQEQAFDQGRAAYTTFSSGGTDYIILGAGWDSEAAAGTMA